MNIYYKYQRENCCRTGKIAYEYSSNRSLLMSKIERNSFNGVLKRYVNGNNKFLFFQYSCTIISSSEGEFSRLF